MKELRIEDRRSQLKIKNEGIKLNEVEQRKMKNESKNRKIEK
jgi:hypothetical protein